MRQRLRPKRRAVLGGGTTIALLALWELLARTEVLPPTVPPISEDIAWLAGQLDSSSFWAAIGWTVWHWAAGLAIGSAAGIVVGVMIGTVPLLHRLLQVPFELVRPVPPIVYLPLVVLVMGAKAQTVILLVAVGSSWPLLFQTYYGVRAVDPVTVDTAAVFGLSRRQRLRNVTIPSMLPFVATGLRISVAVALVIAIAIELVGGIHGIGASLGAYNLNGVYEGVYGLIVVAGLLGVTLNALLEHMERRLLRWHVSQRRTT